MKHDLQAFSREIVALIKTSGDTGASGDKRKKFLQHNDFCVPTREAVVSQSKTSGDSTLYRVGTEKPCNSSRLREASPMSPLPPLILKRAEQRGLSWTTRPDGMQFPKS
jgi:hypothetical protein